MQGYNETLIKPDPMNLSSYYYSQYGQDAFLEEFIFKGKLKEGFFVEAGAADGVLDSNTLVKREQIMFCCLCWIRLGWMGFEIWNNGSFCELLFSFVLSWIPSGGKCHQSHYFEVFELLHGWGGLLVEANPLQFVQSLASGRRAWQVVMTLYWS